MSSMSTRNRNQLRAAVDLVEHERTARGLSIRKAADRAGLSEATWRQLVAGHVQQGERLIERHPRLDQVLAMGAAVELLDEIAMRLGASPKEVETATANVRILDPAEEEIMGSRHLTPTEKLILLEQLHRARKRHNDNLS